MSADLWTVWWAWASFALVLAILEVLAPGFIFLGFAIGAGVVALLLAILGAGGLGGVPIVLVVFAVVSLIAWLILRRSFSLKSGQVKTFDRDIND